eukprot:1160946-Pelagomonas_calceolata.AAC.5
MSVAVTLNIETRSVTGYGYLQAKGSGATPKGSALYKKEPTINGTGTRACSSDEALRNCRITHELLKMLLQRISAKVPTVWRERRVDDQLSLLSKMRAV